MLVPYTRTLKRGKQGKDVLAVQRALAKAKYRRWGNFTSRYGAFTVRNVKKFQRDHNLKADGVYGPATHKKLAPYFDRYGAALMLKRLAKQRQAGVSQKGIPAAVAAALILYNNRYHCHYTQGSARMTIVRNKIRDLAAWFRRGNHLYEDCSSSCTGYYFIGSIPDPNGLGYNGQGYTGTLAVHGRRVSSPMPGDLGFYGYYPYRHVVIYVGNGRCVSFGSNPPKLISPYYRSDFSHWRRYV